MYETSEIRKGLKVKIDGYPWIVVDFHFVKPGKGTAFTRVRLKNLKTGSVLERTYKTGERLEEANFEDRLAQFQYSDPDNYHFMDQENYEQIAVSAAIVGEGKNFLLENMIVSVLFYEGVPMSLEFPTFIETRITYTEPGVRGDTATGTTKAAQIITGHSINVPLFINEGDMVKIDTRTGDYVERVKIGR